MKTYDISFADRPKLLSAEIIAYNYIDIGFAPCGDYWRQMRRIYVLELLSARKVQSFRSIREKESWNLVESVAMKRLNTINLSNMIFTTINTIISRMTIGSRCKDQDHQERRVSGQSDHENEDLIDVLLRIKDDGGLQFPLAFDNIKAVILDMIVAGSDTSSVTIEWAMSELIKSPRVMKKAQDELRQVFKGRSMILESDMQELNYLKLVIKETLRLHPPVPFLLPRECRKNCEIGGYNMFAKTKVIINSWMIGRDTDYWIDAESFIPERFSDSSANMIGTDFEYVTTCF
ncbi:hypothetical protein L1987_60663 [Smallanthus sonchifolius]|uniref:Uncharacterized protein n=1 Tax=Smallanthus sonchifolius TaxID=185202 RepID=A0ACB9D8P7_9ASTR|nr:hypothetical protein L1987_60663 [Smallanthus sonchifolius]